MQTWATCKPQKTLPARTHWSTTIPSRKITVHEGAFMSFFTRQSGGQRVVPNQDSEDTQQQFSHACPCSIKAFLLPFYPWRHSCEEMYQALSCFIVLQATGSWARACYISHSITYWNNHSHSSLTPMPKMEEQKRAWFQSFMYVLGVVKEQVDGWGWHIK